MGDDRRRKNNDWCPTCAWIFQQSEYKIATEGAREDQTTRSVKTWVFQTNEWKQQEIDDAHTGVDVV
jgi:hypothetical protein